MRRLANSDIVKSLSTGGLTDAKAREILNDGTAHGHPITDRQRRFFGAKSEGKAEGGSVKPKSVTKTKNNMPTDYLTYLQGYGVGKDIHVSPIEAATMPIPDLKKKYGVELNEKGLQYANEFHNWLMNNSENFKDKPQYRDYGDSVPSATGNFAKGGLTKNNGDGRQLLKKLEGEQKIPNADEGLNKKVIMQGDGMTIYSVNGNYVRHKYNPDFVVGGNHGRYKFIPDPDIWIDDAYANDPKDPSEHVARDAAIIHELNEHIEMKEDKKKYNPAHNDSNKVEQKFEAKQGYARGGKTRLKTNLKSLMEDRLPSHSQGNPHTGYYKTPSQASGLADGGKITGKGGPKDDAIKMHAPDGSFIVPAENAETAISLGKDYLGWDGYEKAKREYSGGGIKVSDGEVLYTPEEVSILKYHGVDLNKLAPNAKPGDKAADGLNVGKDGPYPDELTSLTDPKEFASKYTDLYEGKTQDDAMNAYKDIFGASNPKLNTKDLPGIQKDPLKVKSEQDDTKEPSTFQKLMDMAPEIAGSIQTGAAAYGLAKAGREPDINVSTALKGLTADLRKDAEYGLEPGTKAAMENQAERERRQTQNAIMLRGGSSGEVMNDLQSMLSTSIDKKYKIELDDASEKMKKMEMYSQATQKLGEQEFDANKIKREDWLKQQEANAALLTAGISNIVGARKLKREMDLQELMIKNNKVNFNITKQ